jgi:hypothetical protein
VSDFHRCQGCGDPGVEPQFSFCGHCAAATCVHCRRKGRGEVCPSCFELLAWHGGEGLPPVPVPAAAPAPEHNGFWLYHAAVKRGVLEWFQSFGTDHGYPSNMTKWSRAMTAQAIEARQAATRGAAK